MALRNISNVQVAYVVSRFPHVTETFILREFTEVDRLAGFSVSLHSLFPAKGEVVHPEAQPWVRRLHRGSATMAAAGLARAAMTSPVRLAGVLARVVADYGRRPRLLWRALVTVAIACGHAGRMRRQGVDHVHAHYATYPALTAWVLHRLLGTTYSVTAHAHDLYVHQCGLARVLRSAAFVAVISSYNRGFVAAVAGSRVPSIVIRCGVDLERYAFVDREQPEGKPARVVCVSSFSEYKGHAVLVEALKRPELRGRVHLVLVGEGELRAAIELQVRTAGLEGAVTFCGALPQPAVLDELRRADLLVQPSIVAGSGQTEGIPVSLVEAMACGVPVVATDVSGVAELVRHGDTGLLAEAADPGALARRIREVLDDPRAARRRAAAARREIERAYDARTSAARMAELFAAASGPTPGRSCGTCSSAW